MRRIEMTAKGNELKRINENARITNMKCGTFIEPNLTYKSARQTVCILNDLYKDRYYFTKTYKSITRVYRWE